MLTLFAPWSFLFTRSLEVVRCKTSDEKPVCIVSIPYVGRVSEMFKRTSECYNIGTVFKTRYTFGSYLRKNKLFMGKLERSHCIFKILCKCRCYYIGETGRPLGVRLKECKYELEEGHFDKSELAED